MTVITLEKLRSKNIENALITEAVGSQDLLRRVTHLYMKGFPDNSYWNEISSMELNAYSSDS